MKRLCGWLIALLVIPVQAQMVYRPVVKPPFLVLTALGACAQLVSWRYAEQSKKIVAPVAAVAKDKKSKKEPSLVHAESGLLVADLPYEKFRHELIAEVSGSLGAGLLLFAGNYFIMTQLCAVGRMPPFNKRNAMIAFANILGGWSGVQFCILPYGVCKFLVLSPEWVKFLEDPSGKVELKERLRKMIAAKMEREETDRVVRLAARLARTALMKDIDLDAAYIEAIAKKRAQRYWWGMAVCLEWAMISAAYLTCAS